MSQVTSEFPNAGYQMVLSHVEVMGYRVPEQRVRESPAHVDPLSVAHSGLCMEAYIEGNTMFHILVPSGILMLTSVLAL